MTEEMVKLEVGEDDGEMCMLRRIYVVPAAFLLSLRSLSFSLLFFFHASLLLSVLFPF
jgi:hypothetical protein